MTEHKSSKAKKPEGNLEHVKVAQGLEMEPKVKPEVAGHISAMFLCFNCGASNWVPPGHAYFICWKCGALNWI